MFMAGSAITDNGVKSAVQEAQSTGTMTAIKLTKEEADAWDNGKTPEGLRFTNAGGVIFSGGTKKYSEELGVYYTDGASKACEAIDTAREAMQADGLDWQNGTYDYTSYYLPEVVRRYKEHDPELSEAADMLLDYLKDYPRGRAEYIQ